MRLRYCGLLPRALRSFPYHRHDAYEFHYVVGGRGLFEIGARQLAIGKGDFFYTQPRSEHRSLGASEGEYLLQYVAHLELAPRRDGEFAADLDAHLEEAAPLRLGDRYHAFFAEISRLCASGDPQLTRAAAFRFAGFLYELMAGSPASQHVHPAVAMALDLMRSRVSEVFDLKDLAAQVGLEKSYFVRLFKKSVGVPPMKYAISLKMIAAADLLRATSDPLAVVAAQVGFADPYHFAKRFKQWSGVPPGTYRRSG